VIETLDSPPKPQHRPFGPQGAQRAIIAATDRELVVEGPADTGKSRTAFEKIHAALSQVAGARVLYCRLTRESCTDSGLVTYEEKVLPPDHPAGRGPKRDQRHSYKYPNGSELVVGGLDKAEKHFSAEYDWVFVQECSELTEDDWENLLRAGRFGVLPYPQLFGDMNPTYEGHWLYERIDRGQTRHIELTHRDNPSLTPDRLDSLRRMTGTRHTRLYLGRRVVELEGSYYGALLSEARYGTPGRYGPLPVDPAQLTHLSFDLGATDLTTIWFWQVSGRQRWVVDYFEGSGLGIGDVGGVLQRKGQRFGYRYGTLYLPHDVAARVQAFAVETRLDGFKQLFPNNRLVVVPRVHDVAERIEATRQLIPLCWFDSSKAPVDDPEARNTAQGFQRLMQYKREYHEKTGVYSAQPRHDAASHAADGFGTFAQGWREPVVVPPPTTAILFQPR
jgi:hypothetical protein